MEIPTALRGIALVHSGQVASKNGGLIASSTGPDFDNQPIHLLLLFHFLIGVLYCIIEVMNKPLLILLVDDEGSFREIFSTKLRAEGFEVETAENGDEGVTKAARLKPDLILMDMEMPGLNGAGAVIKLRENPETKTTKIAFLTNYGEPQNGLHEADRHFAKELGAQEYVKKTDDLDTIVDRVKELL